jgi:manganese/zinc/iron transport system permease protein
LVYCFDPAFAASTGLPVKLLEHLLSVLTVLSVVLGMQAVGVVLMAALWISPAAAARYWSYQLTPMLLLALCFGALASLLGVWMSAAFSTMPTGPWMVVFMSVFAFLSALVAPQKGIWARFVRKRRKTLRINEENILKALFYDRSQAFESLHLQSGIAEVPLTRALARLQKRKLLYTEHGKITLTESGTDAANRIVRLHRLWELYLSHRMSIASDHVHADAEYIEHLLTPELEAQLEQELGFPTHDPHNREIPRKG